ncbi:MAG: pectate lyase, partial [Prevotella sp.]|nr:pectate lyase [Prevotella sp.]
FPKGSRPAGWDSDKDGMPDAWELANGLNPNNASDAALFTIDTEKQWYSNLEVYLNSLVEDIMKNGNADAQSTVDDYYPSCVNGIQGLEYSEPMGCEYYTLDGIKLSTPSRGLFIRVERKADGSRVSRKLIRK